MNKVPEQCLLCLNLTPILDCKAMTRLQEKPCFARVTDPSTLAKRLKEIYAYSGKALIPVDAELLEELKTYLRRAEYITDREIHSILAEDRRRGKRGGGGEQEKAPNKKRPKKPIVWPWED